MPQIYLFATLSNNGARPVEVRYLHATREELPEAEELCADLNGMIVNANYRVVDE